MVKGEKTLKDGKNFSIRFGVILAQLLKEEDTKTNCLKGYEPGTSS